MSCRWYARHPLEKLGCGLAWMAVALLLSPWPWALATTAAVTFLALGPAGVRPRLWFTLYSAPLVFAAFALVPLSWNYGWSADVCAAPLRSAGASAALLLLGLTTPMEEWLALAARARVPIMVIDLAYLIYRFLSATVDELASMQRMLRMRAPGTRWRARLDAASRLGATLLDRTLARAARAETALAARGVDGMVKPVGSFAVFSPVAALWLVAVPLAVLAGGLL